GAFDRRAYRRFRLVVTKGRRQGDPLALQRAFADTVAIGDAVIGQAVPVARIRPLDRVEHPRGIIDGARHRPDMGDIAKGRGWVDRYGAEGRFNAGDAAERGRDADRAAGIGADRERTNAGRQRRGAAATAAAGTALEVPRVAADAGERRVGDRLPAEFWG